MKLKKIMLVSLILLAILMIGAVSAADTSDELAVSDSSGDVIEASLDNGKLSHMSPDDMIINVEDIDTTDSSANFTTISVSEKDGEYVICTGEDEKTVEIYREDLSSSDRDYDDGGKYCFGVSLEDVNKYISDNVKGKDTFQDVIYDGDIVRFVFEYHGNDFAESSYLVKYDNDMIRFLPAPFDFEESLRRVFPFGDIDGAAVLEMESPGEGKFNVIVTNSTGTYTITRELTDDDKVEFLLEDLNITEMGVYQISVKYIDPSGDETDVITDESVIVTEAIVLDQFDIRDDDANLVSVYCPDGSSDYIIVVNVYNIDDDEDEKFIDEFEHVIQSEDYGKYHNWKLSDFGITEGSGEFFKFNIYILQDSTEDPDDDENKLEERYSQAIDSTKFRMEVQEHMNLLSTESVVFVFCPEGSTGWVALNIYKEDENENFIFVKSSTKNINLKDENNWLNWNLGELKIGDGNYKVRADVHNDTVEYQFTEKFEIHNPINIADGPIFIGTDLEDRTRIVEIEIPSDMNATIIINVNGTEKFRNATSDFVKQSQETTPENLTWHYAYRYGYHEDTGFKVYVITTVNMGYLFNPDVYNIEVVVETAAETVNRQANVTVVEVKSETKDGYTIEIYDAGEYDLWDDEWSFASVSSPEGTKGKVKVTIAEDDQWLWEKDFEDHIDINPNEIGLLAGTYEMTVSAYDENGEFVLNNTASITFNYGEVGFMDSEVSEPMEYDDNWGIKIHFLIEDISGQLVIKFDDVTYYDGHVDTNDYEYDWEHNPYIVFSAKHLGVQPGNYDNVTISYSGDDGVEDEDVHKDIEVKPYKPQIYIRYSDWESKKAQFPADDENQFIGVHVNGDDFSKVRIVVKIGDEVCLDAMLEDLGLKENYNPDEDQYYYDIGLSLLNKTFKIGEHYENVYAFYHSDNYDLDTIDDSREGNCPNFFDVIGIADEIDINDDSPILYIIGDEDKEKIGLYIHDYDNDHDLETIYYYIQDGDDGQFITWTINDLGLGVGKYRIEAMYDDNDDLWIFDSEFSVVDKSQFYAIMECDWFFTTDAVIKVWCPVDKGGTIKIIDRDDKGVKQIEHEITDGEKETYVEFTLADLNITRPDWYGIDIKVDEDQITGPDDGLHVPSPIQMPDINIYLPEVGFKDDESMKIAQLELPSGVSGNVVVTIDGTGYYNESIDDIEYAVDGPKNIYKIYTSDLGNSIGTGIQNVVVTFNEFTESRTLDFRDRNSKTENEVTIIILNGDACAYWGDIIAEIIAPNDENGRVVVKLNDSKAAEWNELGRMDNDKYDDDHVIYYIHTYDLEINELGKYNVIITYDDSVSNEDSILFMGDNANQVNMWAESEQTGFVTLDNERWIHFQPNDKDGRVIISVGDEVKFNMTIDEMEDSIPYQDFDWGREYYISPSNLSIASPVSYNNMIFAFYDANDYSCRYWKIPTTFIISEARADFNSEHNCILYFNDRIIEFHISNEVDGNLTITVDNGDVVYNKTLSQTKNESGQDFFYYVDVSDLENFDAGHHENIIVSYVGNDGYRFEENFENDPNYHGTFEVYWSTAQAFLYNDQDLKYNLNNDHIIKFYISDKARGILNISVDGNVAFSKQLSQITENGTDYGFYYDIPISDLDIAPGTRSNLIVSYVGEDGYTFEENFLNQGQYQGEIYVYGYPNFEINVTGSKGGDPIIINVISEGYFTGDVDVKIGDVATAHVHVENGNGMDNTVILPVGDGYKATLDFDEAGYYLEGQAESNEFNVKPTGSSVVITSVTDGVYLTTNASVGYAVENSTTVTFTISDGSVVVDVTPIDDLADVLSMLNAGSYTITINNAENETHSGDSDSADFVVHKATSSASVPEVTFVYGGSDTVTVDVVNTTGEITGYELLDMSDNPISIGHVEINGMEVTVSDLPFGNYKLQVTVAADDNYNGTTGVGYVVVSKAGSDVTVPEVSDVIYGGTVVVTVTDPVNATGVTAKLYNGESEVIGAVDVLDYDITVNVFGLNVGTYTLNVTTEVDDNHSSVTKSGSIVVVKAGSDVVVPEITFVYGGSDTVTVDVVNSTGAITGYELLDMDDYPIFIGHVEINGKEVTVSDLPAGNYKLQVTVAADDHYNGTTGVGNVVVSRATSSVTVPDVAFNYGESDSVTVTVVNSTGAINGVMLFNLDDTPADGLVDINGNVVTVSGLPVGNYKLQVSVDFDDNYDGATGVGNVVVGKSGSSVAVPEVKFVYNESCTVTVDVVNTTGAITEVVLLNPDDTPVSGDYVAVNGMEVTVFGLPVGNYKLNVTVAADDHYNGTTGTGNVVVTKALSDVAVNDVDDAVYGSQIVVTFTNLVNASGVQNPVIYNDSGVISGIVPVINNTAGNITIPAGLAVGTYTLNVTTIVDNNHENVTKSATIVVGQAESSIEIEDINPVTYPSDVEINYETNSTVTVVAVYVKGTTTEVGTVTQGNKKVTVSGLGAGNYTVSITAEDENHSAKTASKNFTVDPKDNDVYLSIEDTHYSDYINIYISGVQVAGTYVVTCEGNTVNVDVSEVSPGVFEGSTYVRWNLAVGTGYEASVSLDNSNYTTWGADLFDITLKDNPVTLTIGNVEYGEKVLVEISNAFVAGTYKVNLTDGKYVDVVVNDASVSILSGSAYADWDLAVGTGYSASVSLDNSNYTTNGSTTFDVLVAGSDVVVPASTNVSYDGSVNVDVTAVNATGIEAKLYNAGGTEVGYVSTSGSGSAYVVSVDVAGLALGTYTLNVTTEVDTNHSAVTKSGSIVVVKAGSDVTVPASTTVDSGSSVVVTVTDSVNATGVNAELYQGSTKVRDLPVSGYKITVDAASLSVGAYTLKVTTIPIDENHAAVTKSGNVAVWAYSNVEVTGASVVYGGNTVATISGLSGASGVNAELLYNGSKVRDLSVRGNSIAISAVDLNVGEYTLKVTTIPAAYYYAVSKESTVTVNPVDSTISDISPIFMVYGDSSTVTVETTGATGIKADLFSGNILIPNKVTVNGNTVTIADVDVGQYTLKVTTIPDGNHKEATDTAGVNVTKANVNMDISAGNVTYPGDIVVTVKSDVSGNYSLFVDTASPHYIVLEANVEKVVPFVGLNAGTHEFTLAYSGSQNYNAGSKSASGTVAKGDVDMSVVAGDVTYPEPVSVSVKSDVAGNYSLFVDTDSPLYISLEANVEKVVPFAGLNAGTHKFTLAYLGSDNYNAGSKSVNATVAKADVDLTILAVNVTYPESVVVTVMSDVSGNYSLIMNTTSPQYITLEALKPVDVNFGVLPAGTYEFTLAYAGSQNYNPATESIKETVAKAENTTINIEATSPLAGENATVSVTLPADATGTVEVKYGNGVYTAPVEDGIAVISLPTNAAGTENATVKYSGDNNYPSASGEVAIAVKPNGVIIAENIKRGVNSPYDYYATLVDINGKPVKGVEITFTIDGKTYNATTNASGIATVSAGLGLVKDKNTVYNVTVTNPYTLENVTATTTIVPRLIVVSGVLTADYLQNPPYIVQAIGDDGNPVGAGETVRVVFAGFYYDLKTNATGHVVRTIGLAPGMYAVKACYEGYNTTATVFTVKQVMKVTSGTLKKTAKSYTLKATLKSSKGKALAGKEVKLTFNGKTYTVTTNSKGVASYIIKSGIISKLKAGKTYELKAKYVNDVVKGKIKVVSK